MSARVTISGDDGHGGHLTLDELQAVITAAVRAGTPGDAEITVNQGHLLRQIDITPDTA